MEWHDRQTQCIAMLILLLIHVSSNSYSTHSRQAGHERKPPFVGNSECCGQIFGNTATGQRCQVLEERRKILRLRGGDPKAMQFSEDDDILVHFPSSKVPPPHHRCLKSALHRSKVAGWNGRRVFLRTSYIDEKQTPISRYGWKGPIRIGNMKHGSGNETVARVAGDDQVQLWGQWHFGGHCVGMFRGLYSMFTDYGPYKILILVERQADVVFDQCDIRNFGGKCIVGRYFADVSLSSCTVGGSCGSQATPNHKKLQLWRPEAAEMVRERAFQRQINKLKSGRRVKKAVAKEDIDLGQHWAPGGSRHASDGVSMESGSVLLARRVCFEDTGRARGIALRCVGHSRATLFSCRFQRNLVDLAADATAVLTLQSCHEFHYDPDRRGQRGYKGEKTEFYAHRALRLPGNGTSILEAQDPSGGDVLAWREVTPTNRYWTDQKRRGVDPNKQAKRIRERAQRKRIREKLRDKYPDGIPKHIKVFAPRTDFTAFTMPQTAEQKRIDENPRRRHQQILEVFNAPETLGERARAIAPLGQPRSHRTSVDAALKSVITPDLQRLAAQARADSERQQPALKAAAKAEMRKAQAEGGDDIELKARRTRGGRRRQNHDWL